VVLWITQALHDHTSSAYDTKVSLQETDMTGQDYYTDLARTAEICICSSPECEISWSESKGRSWHKLQASGQTKPNTL
jgi:phosphoribosyl-AMP cyclohydrolase